MCDAAVALVTSSVCTSSFTHNRNSGFGQEARDIASFYCVIFSHICYYLSGSLSE